MQNKMQKPVKIAIKVLYNRKWTKTLIFVSFFCLLFRANVPVQFILTSSVMSGDVLTVR